MNLDVMKRLNRLETIKTVPDIPEIVFISKVDEGFKIQETYCKHDAKGRIIDGSGENKVFTVKNKDDYVLPEGFKGVCIDESNIYE